MVLGFAGNCGLDESVLTRARVEQNKKAESTPSVPFARVGCLTFPFPILAQASSSHVSNQHGWMALTPTTEWRNPAVSLNAMTGWEAPGTATETPCGRGRLGWCI
jgi:hypothetical protein